MFEDAPCERSGCQGWMRFAPPEMSKLVFEYLGIEPTVETASCGRGAVYHDDGKRAVVCDTCHAVGTTEW